MSAMQSNMMQRYLRPSGDFVIEVIKVVVISLAIILPVRYFLIQPFYVKGASMEPNFHDYEYLIIDEISYRFNSPVRGQTVVLHDPRDPSQFFIKRVLGLPGETISFKNGKVQINGVDIDEAAYLAGDVVTTSPTNHPVVIGDNEYFLMGDNRSASYDSRRFGPVDESELVGRVWIRAWPFNRLQIF